MSLIKKRKLNKSYRYMKNSYKEYKNLNLTNIAKEVRAYAGGKTHTYEYTYDADGNMIKKICNGKMGVR